MQNNSSNMIIKQIWWSRRK